MTGKIITINERRFESHKECAEHCRKLRDKWHSQRVRNYAGSSPVKMDGEDLEFVLALLKRHPRYTEKKNLAESRGAVGLGIVEDATYGNICFAILTKRDEDVSFSYFKCIQGVYKKPSNEKGDYLHEMKKLLKEQQGNKCLYCDIEFFQENLDTRATLDHVVPSCFTKGIPKKAQNHDHNLLMACHRCNTILKAPLENQVNKYPLTLQQKARKLVEFLLDISMHFSPADAPTYEKMAMTVNKTIEDYGWNEKQGEKK